MSMPRLLGTTCLFLLVAPMICLAQGDRGNITGGVTDPAGAAVPDATGQAKNPATGLVQETKTGSNGNYNLPYLPVGKYTLSVEKPGFSAAERTDITVDVGTTARIDVKLQVGQVQQRIEVSADASPVESERSDLGAVLTSKQIIDLPLSLGGGLRDNLPLR